jgi:hypothetical protein
MTAAMAGGKSRKKKWAKGKAGLFCQLKLFTKDLL